MSETWNDWPVVPVHNDDIRPGDTVQIDRVVFEAVDKGSYLPVGVPVLLEGLSRDHDGIFPNEKSWRAFCRGNFASDGELWLEGECKASTIKRWCPPLADYRGRFVIKIGADKWVQVDPADLEFSFTYDLNWYNRETPDFPCRVDIYVTATIKG